MAVKTARTRIIRRWRKNMDVLDDTAYVDTLNTLSEGSVRRNFNQIFTRRFDALGGNHNKRDRNSGLVVQIREQVQNGTVFERNAQHRGIDWSAREGGTGCFVGADCNHLGRNLDYFAKAALGKGSFPIPPQGILHTACALEAVFKSVDANGAWMTV